MIPDVTPNGVFYLPPTGWLTSFYNPPFKKKLIHPQEFLNEINNFHNVELGDFQASEVDLVIHDWYNRQPHLIERFSLKTT